MATDSFQESMVDYQGPERRQSRRERWAGHDFSPDLTSLLQALDTNSFETSELVTAADRLSPEERTIFHTCLFDGMRERNMLIGVQGNLGRQLELGPLIQAIVFHISSILHADRSSLFLIDRQRQELWSKVAQGLDFAEIRFPMTIGLAGHVARSGETLNIEDVYQHPLFNPEIDRKTGYHTRTMLCMPIQNREGKIIGVVQVINKLRGKFNGRDLDTLRSLTRMLSLALENALLYESVCASQRKIEALLNVANALNSSIDLHGVISTIMSKAAELLDADRSTLFLVDKETSELWSSVASGGEVKEIRFPKHLGIAGQVATTGKTLNIPDAYEFPGFNREIDKKTGYRTRSILCMPIHGLDDEIIGVTQVINKNGGAFERNDEEMLSAFSSQAAVSLQNSQLFARTSQMKAYLEAILTSLSNGVVTLDQKRRLVKVNPFAMKMLGIECAAELYGRPIGEILGQANHRLLEEIEKVYANGQQASVYDFDYHSEHGGLHAINFNVVPLIDEQETRHGVVLVFEDITREKRVKSNLTRYMSKDLVDKLTSGSGTIELGGSRREVTILFSDIRGYTSLTEKLGPNEIVEMLNDYFTHMVDAIFKYDGVLDKFIGDAIMAVFGAPVPLPDHAFRSVQAALEMKRSLKIFNQQRVERGQIPIQIGIGISTGEVLCGNIGSNKRMEYTAIGDGVNLSSRLESATKLYRAITLLSEFTYEQVRDRVFVRELDFIRVKGKQKPVRIYELLGETGTQLEDAMMRSIDAFRRGHELFFKRDFTGARSRFEESLRHNPQDLPSTLYLTRCKACLESPPPDSWDGVYDLKEK